MFFLGFLIAVIVLAAVGCGGEDGGSAPEALPSSSCTAIEYEGEGHPDYIIASDLPLQGSSRSQTLQINDAIRFELRKREFAAGDYKIGFQACDDATVQAGKWDSRKCSQNANSYAANDKLIGVIGTFNSGCAAIVIPVLNRAPDGGIAMVSPANSLVCLTEASPGCDKAEPDKYYPSGSRNYVRVAPHDGYQGAAAAEFLQSKSVESVYILNDKEAYGLGVATSFRNAAESLGIKIAGFAAWDSKASSYEALYENVQQTGADAVFLGGLLAENGAQVIKDKVDILGPNDGDVKLLAPDKFATQRTIDESGDAARGMFMSVAGVLIDEFRGPGKEFADAFSAEYLDGKPTDPYAIYGAQSAQVLLDAIESSDGSRGDVISKLFETNVAEGLTGSFSINENGDPARASGAVVGFTFYEATDKLDNAVALSPKPGTVLAARGE